jgi:hypothetical protein
MGAEDTGTYLSKIVGTVVMLVSALLVVGAALTIFFESTAYANELLKSKSYPIMPALGAAALSFMVGVFAIFRHWSKLHRRGWKPRSYVRLVAGLLLGLIVVACVNAASLWIFSFGIQNVIVDITSRKDQTYRVFARKIDLKGCPNALEWEDPIAGRKISFCRPISLFDEVDGYARPALVHARSGRFGVVVLSVSRTS